MITEAALQRFFAARLHVMGARKRVPSPRPRFSRYLHHDRWHVCLHDQQLTFDDGRWIEVTW